jgi:hypothetical protein
METFSAKDWCNAGIYIVSIATLISTLFGGLMVWVKVKDKWKETFKGTPGG